MRKFQNQNKKRKEPKLSPAAGLAAPAASNAMNTNRIVCGVSVAGANAGDIV